MRHLVSLPGSRPGQMWGDGVMLELSRIPILGLQKRKDEEQWYYHTDYSAQARSIKADLRVFLRQRGEQVNWVVVDKDPDGADYITMTVQEPDGSYRPFDGRSLEILRKNFQIGPDLNKIVADLEARDAKKARADEKRDQDIAEAVAEDVKWIGTDVVPSTKWDARSLRREQIRKEANGR